MALGPDGPALLQPEHGVTTGAFAVGDWVSISEDGVHTERLYERQTTLKRMAAGSRGETQLIAANVDTFGIVTSCNHDFNEARLERYLALAASAGCMPLIILTKADQTDDARDYQRRAERLSPLVTAITLNAKDAEDVGRLSPWCQDGQTLVLAGSSGVGKTTLSNALTGQDAATQDIREDDAKGRHTTTSRGLIPTRFGGWLIDTPGMRSLGLTDVADGIEAVFEDIEALTPNCKFRDCEHLSEPGCAVKAAVDAGEVDPDRVNRWRKLKREDAHNTATAPEARAQDRAFAKRVKRAMAEKQGRRK